MSAYAPIPEAVATTIATFEKLIRDDEDRLRMLEAELATLRLRERVIGAMQDVRWLAERFIEPRLAEMRALESRQAILREKLREVRNRWVDRPAAPAEAQAPMVVWVDTGSPAELALTA